MSFLHDSGTRATRRSPGAVSRGTTMRTPTPPSDVNHIRLSTIAAHCARGEGGRSLPRTSGRAVSTGQAERRVNSCLFCGVCLAQRRRVISTTETSPERVLVVAHEPRLRESIRAHLALDRYRCEAVDDGQAALLQARDTPFDLIVVDLSAPNVAGSQISRALRHQPMNRRAPIVIIASRNAEHAALNELEDGADDFLVKPFGPGELAARARAAIRRSRAARARAAVATELSFSPPPVSYGDIAVDPANRHVPVRDRARKLTE